MPGHIELMRAGVARIRQPARSGRSTNPLHDLFDDVSVMRRGAQVI